MEPVHYEDHDEAPHDPGPDPAWQESVFLHWYDPKVGVGGIHRIGHEPSAGITALWCGVVARDGTRFRRSAAISYRGEDRLPDGFAAGPGQQLTFDPRPRMSINPPPTTPSPQIREEIALQKATVARLKKEILGVDRNAR